MTSRGYYRAIPAKYFTGCGKLIPTSTDMEKVDKEGNLVYDTYDDECYFCKEDTPALCFSKSLGGALTGAISAYNRHMMPSWSAKEQLGDNGSFYVCKSQKRPEIDLSDKALIDFREIEEVRYRTPTKTELYRICDIPPGLWDAVADVYRNERFDGKRLISLKAKLENACRRPTDG